MQKLTHLVIIVFSCLGIFTPSIAQNTLIDQSFANAGKLFPRYDRGQISSNLFMDRKNRMMFFRQQELANGDGIIEIVRYTTSGILDNSFDGDGKLILNLSTSSNNDEYANQVVFTSDDKIVFIHLLEGGTRSIVRLNENGGFDNAFAPNGRLLLGSSFFGFKLLLGVGSDNKLFVVGDVRSPNFILQNVIVRSYNTNGTLNSGFGTNGEVNIPVESFPSKFDDLDYLNVHNSGKITFWGVTRDSELLGVQLLSNGTLNSNFGNAGQLVYYAEGNFGIPYTFYSHRLDISGNFIVSGNDNVSATTVVRFNENGQIDVGFGVSGAVVFPLNGNTRLNYSATPSAIGGYLLSGFIKTQNRYQFGLGKLNINGSANTSFGNSGFLNYDVSNNDAIGFLGLEQTDGKIVLVGYSTSSQGYSEIICLRLLSNGTVDDGFANVGILRLEEVVQLVDSDDFNDATLINDFKQLPDGSILHTGSYNGGGLISGNNGIYIAKSLVNGEVDNAFGSNGRVHISSLLNLNTTDTRGGKLSVSGANILISFPVQDVFTGQAILLAKVTAAGLYDPSFGLNGRVLLSPSIEPFEPFEIKDMIIAPNGKIAILIQFFDDYDRVIRSEVFQFLSNGNLDNTFSDDGKFSLPFETTHIRYTSDNKLIVLGVQVIMPSFSKRLALLRLTTNGIADNGFNGGLPLIIGYSLENDVPAGLIIEANNDITIGFDPFNSDREYGIAKISNTGAPIANWGTGGVLVGDLPIGVRGWRYFVKKGTGEYLLIGNKIFDEKIVQILQLNANGSVKTGYGTNGVGNITFNGTNAFSIRSVALTGDGKLLLAGNEQRPSGSFYSRLFASIVRLTTGDNSSFPSFTMLLPGNWSNSANWQNGLLPPTTIVPGTTITINPSGNGIAILDIPITVQSGATITVLPGKTLRVNANLTIPSISIN